MNAEFAGMLADFGIFQKLSEGVDQGDRVKEFVTN